MRGRRILIRRCRHLGFLTENEIFKKRSKNVEIRGESPRSPPKKGGAEVLTVLGYVKEIKSFVSHRLQVVHVFVASSCQDLKFPVILGFAPEVVEEYGGCFSQPRVLDHYHRQGGILGLLVLERH